MVTDLQERLAEQKEFLKRCENVWRLPPPRLPMTESDVHRFDLLVREQVSLALQVGKLELEGGPDKKPTLPYTQREVDAYRDYIQSNRLKRHLKTWLPILSILGLAASGMFLVNKQSGLQERVDAIGWNVDVPLFGSGDLAQKHTDTGAEYTPCTGVA